MGQIPVPEGVFIVINPSQWLSRACHTIFAFICYTTFMEHAEPMIMHGAKIGAVYVPQHVLDEIRLKVGLPPEWLTEAYLKAADHDCAVDRTLMDHPEDTLHLGFDHSGGFVERIRREREEKHTAVSSSFHTSA